VKGDENLMILLSNSFDDAVLAYAAKQWYNTPGNINLGRTILQKIGYFIKSKGVPIDFEFDIYHYGPYSQELYNRVDQLLLDNILVDESGQPSKSIYKPGSHSEELINMHHDELDKYVNDIETVIRVFSRLNPTQMELLATIHFFQTTLTKYYQQPPQKEVVIQRVLEAKGDKFSHQTISGFYDTLEKAGLFAWSS